MTANIVENMVVFISHMYMFIARFYSDFESDKVLDEYSTSDFLLPEEMINILRKFVIRVKDTEILGYPKFINTPILRMYCMMEFTKIRHDLDDMKFLELCAFLCLVAFKCEEKGIDKAAEAVMKIIHQNCFRYRKYHVFKKLGCKL